MVEYLDLSCNEKATEGIIMKINRNPADTTFYLVTPSQMHISLQVPTKRDSKKEKKIQSSGSNLHFSRHVQTNVGRAFLILFQNQLLKSYKHNKIFNKESSNIHSIIPLVSKIFPKFRLSCLVSSSGVV